MRQEYREQPVQWYLTACYCYEVLDDPCMSDAEFDELGAYIAEYWDLIEHRHKYLIDPARCAHTSGVTLRYDEWPLLVLGAIHAQRKVPLGSSPVYRDALLNAEVRALL